MWYFKERILPLSVKKRSNKPEGKLEGELHSQCYIISLGIWTLMKKSISMERIPTTGTMRRRRRAHYARKPASPCMGYPCPTTTTSTQSQVGTRVLGLPLYSNSLIPLYIDSHDLHSLRWFTVIHSYLYTLSQISHGCTRCDQ